MTSNPCRPAPLDLYDCARFYMLLLTPGIPYADIARIFHLRDDECVRGLAGGLPPTGCTGMCQGIDKERAA